MSDLQQQPQQPQAPMSDEQIMGQFFPDPGEAPTNAPESPRDEKGRFVPKQEPEKQAEPQAEQQEEQQEEQPDQETPDTYKFDEVKDIKIKIPMKSGDKEWEEELSLHDLREGHMMRKDYLQKTQELAEQKRQTERQVQDSVEKERGQYMQTLNALQQSILHAAAPELANVNWSALASENPAEYIRLQNRAREVNDALVRVNHEQQKLLAQQEKERVERLSRAVEESRTQLLQAIPDWTEDKYQSLMKRGIETYGFKPDEIKQIYDHRIMRLLNDANQFQAMKEGKSVSEKKVVNAPPVLKPGSQKPRVNPRMQLVQNAQSRLQASSGNDIDAAADLMGAFIDKK